MSQSDQPSVDDIATAWFVRLRDDNVNNGDRAKFEAWLDADAAHAKAYSELERLWEGLELIDRENAGLDEAVLAQQAVAQKATLGHKGVLRLAAAASVMLFAGIGAYNLAGPSPFADHRTGTGEQLEIALQDGSTVHLNTATSLSVDFTEGSRRITLHGGEAYFEVTGNPDRPFVVETDRGDIEALGTAFSVQDLEDRMSVIVVESQVEVTAVDGASVILGDGQGVRVTDAGLQALSTDHDDALAWLQGRMVFESRPLGDVLEELDRYRRGTIVVLDDITRAMPVTGSFSVHDTDETLDTIEQALPIKVRRMSGFLVLVGVAP